MHVINYNYVSAVNPDVLYFFKNVKIASVNGEDITKAEFIYFLTNVKNQIESEQGSDLPEDFWETAEIDGKKVIETAKEKALEEAIKSKISRKKAIEGGYKITSEQYQDINNRIGQLVAKYGNEGVDDYLKQFGLNKNLYQKFLKTALSAKSYGGPDTGCGRGRGKNIFRQQSGKGKACFNQHDRYPNQPAA